VVRLLLDRSSDSASRDEPTQDYLVLDYAPSELCFAVTDGVGSSFVGQLAAQLLARRVVDWLFELRAVPDERQLSSDLMAFLAVLATEADKIVTDYPIPKERSALVIDVLEQQRAYGSEAMIVCGRIDWSDHGAAHVGLAWLGDAQLRVQLRGGRAEHLSGRTSDRWSTKRGPRGDVQSWVRPTSEVDRIIACSDGLIPELDAAVELADSALEARLRRLASGSASDDIAFLDIALVANAMPPMTSLHDDHPDHLSPQDKKQADLSATGHIQSMNDPETPGRSGVPGTTLRDKQGKEDPGRAEPDSAEASSMAPTHPAKGAPPNSEHVDHGSHDASQTPPLSEGAIGAPASLKWRSTDRGQAIVWEHVQDADAYSVQIADGPEFADPVDYHVEDTYFVLPSMAAPQTWARVQVCVGDRTGPWSQSLMLTAPDLPPATKYVPGRTRNPAAPEQDGVPVPAPSRQRQLEAPAGLETRVSMGRLAMRWRPVAGADSYIVEVEDINHRRPVRRGRASEPRIALWMPRGSYYIRLRASSPDGPGSWTAPIEVRIQ